MNTTQAGSNMSNIISTSSFGGNYGDHFNNKRFGTLLENNIQSIESIISMLEKNLYDFTRENITKHMYENSVLINVSYLRTELNNLKNKEITIRTNTTTTLELKN